MSHALLKSTETPPPARTPCTCARAGTDCTALFESYHAPSLRETSIHARLAAYECRAADTSAADQAGPESMFPWDDTPVYDDVKRVAQAYRSKHGIKATDDWQTMAW